MTGKILDDRAFVALWDDKNSLVEVRSSDDNFKTSQIETLVGVTSPPLGIAIIDKDIPAPLLVISARNMIFVINPRAFPDEVHSF